MEKEHIKKRLVFYFYTFENFTGNRAIQLHLRCLKHYSKVFDEALFIISVDDTENDKLIFDTEVELLKCGFKNVHFKVCNNSSFCECQAFFNEIVKKLGMLDGFTFFGHTKGTTNYGNGWAVEESLDAWILGMYYLNLEYIDELEDYFTRLNGARFYGTFLSNYITEPKNKLTYLGSFYWLNCPVIWGDVKKGIVELPIDVGNRALAEDFPAILYEWEEGTRLASHHLRILYFLKPYENTHKAIDFLLGEDIKKYEKYKNEMLNA